jgi:Predicted oxidoreductases (related to aryl-alcohol dehydrogenases)
LKYNKMAGAGLTVSQFCLGTMTFGDQVNEQDALRIMDYVYEQGGNFIDTANAYTGGESERIVGKGLKGRRDQIILATKVFCEMGKGLNERGTSRHQIIEQANASLKRLDTDYIDIYYLHEYDYKTPLEETMEAINTLLKSGKIRYIGVSNFAAWQIADALAICDKRNYSPPVITENLYNMVTRSIENEFTSFLKEHPMSMVVYNPLAGGFLTGKHKRGEPTKNTRFDNNQLYIDRYWHDSFFDAIEVFKELAKEEGISLVQLSMKWLSQQPYVTSVISGISKYEHIMQNLDALNGDPLSADTLKKCDESWRVLAGPTVKYNR